MRQAYIFLLSAVAIVTGGTVLNAKHPPSLVRSVPSSASSVANASFAQSDRALGGTLARLDLTDSQVKQLQAVRTQYQPLLQEQMAQSRTFEKELQQRLADSSSDTELRSQFQQVVRSQQDLMQIRLENVLAIRKILTPEQRQELIEKMTTHTSDTPT